MPRGEREQVRSVFSAELNRILQELNEFNEQEDDPAQLHATNAQLRIKLLMNESDRNILLRGDLRAACERNKELQERLDDSERTNRQQRRKLKDTEKKLKQCVKEIKELKEEHAIRFNEMEAKMEAKFQKMQSVMDAKCAAPSSENNRKMDNVQHIMKLLPCIKAPVD